MTFINYFERIEGELKTTQDVKVFGTISRISGVLLEASGLKVPIGSICQILASDGQPLMQAETIGFSDETTYLMSFAEPFGVLPGAKIEYVASVFHVPVGHHLLGRVLDGFCQPIDEHGKISVSLHYTISSSQLNPIQRQRICQPFDVGIRAINALLTVGIGQRIGIFSGSGVGKSVLLGMMTRYSEAQVIVVGLIGERGREVKEFIEENIGIEYLKKTVVITAPIDSSPLERTNGVLSAITIAEYFRDQGMEVLLIVDSLTRYAQALRQMYLLLGEPPSIKGYSPSVFAKISQLVERCGFGNHSSGSITAFFTVLTEGDDNIHDPVADHARSVLDGHVILSRALAESGHYPAIDINGSISRVMDTVVADGHIQTARHFKRLYAHYAQNLDLINMGLYKENKDPVLEQAIKKRTPMQDFLQQRTNEKVTFKASVDQLNQLFEAGESHE